jgi:hypothetical protein
MGDLTPSRIEPLGGSPDHQPENPSRKPNARPKEKEPEQSSAPPPPIDFEKSEEEEHQLDEQA